MKNLLLILSVFILTSCSFFNKPQLRKYTVTYWALNSDPASAVIDFQAYELIERDSKKLIFKVKNYWIDTLYLDGKNVSGKLHSLSIIQDHIYQFDGEITEQKYHILKIEGLLQPTSGPSWTSNYVIQ